MKIDHPSLYRIAMHQMGYDADKDPATLPSGPLNDDFSEFLNRITDLKKTGKPGAWCNRVICERCRLESCSAPFSSRHENAFNVVCGGCGTPGQFVDSIERWWSLAVWWRPSTWNVGYWETRE